MTELAWQSRRSQGIHFHSRLYFIAKLIELSINDGRLSQRLTMSRPHISLAPRPIWAFAFGNEHLGKRQGTIELSLVLFESADQDDDN